MSNVGQVARFYVILIGDSQENRTKQNSICRFFKFNLFSRKQCSMHLQFNTETLGIFDQLFKIGWLNEFSADWVPMPFKLNSIFLK